MAGVEPQMTVVFELASRIDKLERTVNAAGLNWLGEWDIDLETDEDFPVSGKRKAIGGRLFVSMVNQQGMKDLLSFRLPDLWLNLRSTFSRCQRSGWKQSGDGRQFVEQGQVRIWKLCECGIEFLNQGTTGSVRRNCWPRR